DAGCGRWSLRARRPRQRGSARPGRARRRPQGSRSASARQWGCALLTRLSRGKPAMACCTLYFHSPALMKACSMTVIVPESGFGAMKLALKFPQLFCSAVAHSAACDVRRRVERLEMAAEMRRIFGPSPAGGPNDLYALAAQIDRQCLPALRIDCGSEDSLLEENRAFHRHLE